LGPTPGGPKLKRCQHTYIGNQRNFQQSRLLVYNKSTRVVNMSYSDDKNKTATGAKLLLEQQEQQLRAQIKASQQPLTKEMIAYMSQKQKEAYDKYALNNWGSLGNPIP
jgi:hypothetical protein